MANQITFQNAYQTSTNRGTFKLGERGMTPDGRKWTFVQNTTSTLANGVVVVPSAAIAVDEFSSSTDNQGRIVYLTSANASYTTGANEDGIGVVDDGTGVGQTFKIKTNGVTTLTLYPETALTTALAVANSDVTIRNMSKVVVAAITSKIQMAQGAIQVSAVSDDYAWVLTEGDGRVMAGEVLIIGSNFTTGDDTVGQVIKGITATGPFDAQNLGYSIVANAAADQGALVRFQIR
jgi:hypothetical protein